MTTSLWVSAAAFRGLRTRNGSKDRDRCGFCDLCPVPRRATALVDLCLMCRRPPEGGLAAQRVMRRLTRLGYWRGLGDGWSTQEAVQGVVAHQAGMGASAPHRDRR